MLDFNGYIANNTCFAAANTYYGFKSNFDEVLERDTLERLLILKGGPGTGKSSLMKAVIKYANHEGIYAEEFLCSSDPSSLDGVVLRDGDKRIAVVDGTAPHVTDPIYPGAFDEIINLGDGFDISYLKGYGEKIKELSKDKARFYKEAYEYLSLAGKVREVMDRKMLECIDSDKVKRLALELVSDVGARQDKQRSYYVSAFCKDGYVRLSENINLNKHKISIKGDGYTEYKVMGTIKALLAGYIEVFCPTPLDPSKPEAIYTDRMAIIAKNNGEVDSTVILNKKPTISEEKRLYDYLIDLAKASFKKASEDHFELEDIYKHGVDFSHNEEIYCKIIKDIERELD